MGGKTATFIGHNECYGLDQTKLREEIRNLIVNEGVDTFLSGGMGGFDCCCARMVHSMRKEFPHIVSILVIPYLNFNVFDRSCFDHIEFPECVDGLFYKAAIVKRNRYLVDNSAFALCYVNRTYGGAYKTYYYAQKMNIKVIDLAPNL